MPNTKPAIPLGDIFSSSRLNAAKIIARIAVIGEKQPQQRINPAQEIIPNIIEAVAIELAGDFDGATCGGE